MYWRNRIVTCALFLLALSAVAQQQEQGGTWPLDAQRHTVVVDAQYWRAKVQCWRDLAKAEASQADNHGTAVAAMSNADAITSALANGSIPVERGIFRRKILPSDSKTHGRPQWRADILAVDAALEQYETLNCRTPLSGCLEVALQSVFENMEESQGARWNHGRPEIDHALELARKAADDLAQCDTPPEPISIIRPVPSVEKVLPSDVTFAFDSAALTPTGRDAVKKMVTDFDKNIRKIRVVGHTDRIGSEKHNAVLSLQRANAIKSAINALSPNLQVIVEGVGAASPVVNCSGAATEATIACLAPNRRVAIQVIQ